MTMASLFFLLACVTSDEKAGAPSVPSRELVRTREVKAALEENMLRVVQAAELASPVLGWQAREAYTTFRDTFGPAVVGSSGKPGAVVYREQDSCAAEPCRQFVLAPFGKLIVAMWADQPEDIVLNMEVDPNDDFASLVVFHELEHAKDPRMAKDAVRTPEGVTTAEDAAFTFESALANAVSGGRYHEALAKAAADVVSGHIPSVRNGEIPIAMVPPVLCETFPDISERSLSALVVLWDYDLNKAIIAQSSMSDADKERAMGELYGKVNVPLTAETAAFIRQGLALQCPSWKI